MNCCAADATPLRAIGRVEDPPPEKKGDGPAKPPTPFDAAGYRNQWVRVTARLQFRQYPGGWMAELVVTPTARRPVGKLIEHIDTPKNPYID
jgi:hypothetical protein